MNKQEKRAQNRANALQAELFRQAIAGNVHQQTTTTPDGYKRLAITDKGKKYGAV